MNQFATQLVEALTSAGIDLRTNYSGRCMFGEQCVAVDVDGRDDPSLGDALEAVQEIKGSTHFKTDSMGLGSVIYWPTAKTKELQPTA